MTQSHSAHVLAPDRPQVKGQPFAVTGKLPGAKRRVVKLQYRTRGGKHHTIASTRTTRHGTFRFRAVTLDKTRSVRAYAPPVRRAGQAAVATRRVPVTVTAPHATLVALPPLAQPGASPSAAPTGTALSAHFDLDKPTGTVSLLRLTGRGWTDVAEERIDKSGNAVFTVEGPASQYKAVWSPARSGVRVPTNVTATRSWQLTWEDDFTGPDLDPTKWVSQNRDYVANGKRSCWKASASAYNVSDGVLRLGMRPDPERAGVPCSYATTTAPVVSGVTDHLLGTQVATQGTFSFQHGYAAARIKTQDARGMHAGFWTLPANPSDSWLHQNQTEVDVMEFFGSRGTGRDRFGTFTHHLPPGAATPLKYGQLSDPAPHLLGEGETWDNAFHVFSVEWTPTEYVFRVDGKEHYRESRGVSDYPAMLVLSMQAADFEIGRLDPRDLNQSADVDWVRVWAP